MSLLQLVAAGGQQINEPLRFRCVLEGTEVAFPSSDSHLQQAHERGQRNDREENNVAEQDFERQLRQIESMALQHYPEDEAGRNAYMVDLLKQRLREYAARFVQLDVKEMK